MTGLPKARALFTLLAVLLGGGIVLAQPASAATVTLRAGVAGLPVATEIRTD